MRVMVLVIVATLLAGAAQAQQAATKYTPQITGVYSSLSIHAETLDVLGYELIISKMSGNDYEVTLQCAEGQVSRPVLAEATLSGGFLTFKPMDHACGSEFKLRITRKGLRLTIDSGTVQFVPRHHSFWENHQ